MNRRGQKRSGSVLVELALVVPLATAMLLGVIHFGWAFHVYIGLERAVRDGARYAAMRPMNNNSFGNYQAAVQNVVVSGFPAGGTGTVPTLTTGAVNVQRIPGGTARPTRIRVSVSSLTIPGFGMYPAFTLTNRPSVEMVYLGQYLN